MVLARLENHPELGRGGSTRYLFLASALEVVPVFANKGEEIRCLSGKISRSS